MPILPPASWRCLAAIALTAAIGANAHAQRVTTLPPVAGLFTPDGLAVDANGEIFIADYKQGTGTRVLHVTRDGRTAVFADGFSAPDGLAFHPDGSLYVSNFTSGIINRVTLDGRVSVFARGLDHPAGLVFHRGYLYVANFGNFNGTTVSRISENGEVETFATGFTAPLGIAVGHDSALYVTNFGSGEVHRVDDAGRATVFARVPNSPIAQLQFIALGNDGTLFVPSLGHNRVYAIDRRGVARVHAGGVAGGNDGDGTLAQLHAPNAIARLPDGSLVVAEYTAGRLRRVESRVNSNAPLATVWPASTTTGIDAARLANDAASYTIRSSGDSIGVINMRRTRNGKGEITIVRTWVTAQQTRTDSSTTSRSMTMSAPSLANAVDATIVADAVAALPLAEGYTTALPLYSQQQMGALVSAVSNVKQISATYDGRSVRAWSAVVAYPSALLTIVCTQDSRAVVSATYDYGGGRVIELLRR